MGYFKTLALDPSAAYNYHQRWDGLRAAAVAPVATSVKEFTQVSHPTEIFPQGSTVNLTREHVGRALREWRRNVQHNMRDLNTVNRAALNLEACLWYVTPDGELVITSATDSRTRYHVTPDCCDCRAATLGRPCWHMAAYRLLHTADAMRRLEASQKTVQHATAQALVDELF